MNDFLIIVGIGFIVFVLGIVLLKRERSKFAESVTTDAKVVTYYDYMDIDGEFPIKMYTMAVEYQDQSGKQIQAREQSSSSTRKYPIGTIIPIIYSSKKHDLFVVAGDKSRFFLSYGMIIVGLLMMFGLGWALLQRL